MARNSQITPRRGVNLACFLPLRFFDNKMTEIRRKSAQIHGKTPTKRPKWGQNSPKKSRNPGRGSGTPRGFQPKTSQKRAKKRSKSPKNDQNEAKTAPKQPKTAQNSPKKGSKQPKTEAKPGQSRGKTRPKQGQNQAQSRVKEGQKRHQKNGSSWGQKKLRDKKIKFRNRKTKFRKQENKIPQQEK